MGIIVIPNLQDSLQILKTTYLIAWFWAQNRHSNVGCPKFKLHQPHGSSLHWKTGFGHTCLWHFLFQFLSRIPCGSVPLPRQDYGSPEEQTRSTTVQSFQICKLTVHELKAFLTFCLLKFVASCTRHLRSN